MAALQACVPSLHTDSVYKHAPSHDAHVAQSCMQRPCKAFVPADAPRPQAAQYAKRRAAPPQHAAPPPAHTPAPGRHPPAARPVVHRRHPATGTAMPQLGPEKAALRRPVLHVLRTAPRTYAGKRLPAMRFEACRKSDESLQCCMHVCNHAWRKHTVCFPKAGSIGLLPVALHPHQYLIHKLHVF